MANLGNLAVGAKIKIPHTDFGDIVFLKADSDHEGYPTGSTTLIAEKIIALRCADAIEPNSADSNQRSYGNNKYSVSNIDQWLNSAADAGEWYTPQHDKDQAPDNAHVWSNYNEYDEDAGFLHGFDPALVSAMLETTLKVALNTVTDGGGYETITRKVFLASRAETFGAAENNVMEGSMLAIFAANTNDCRKAYLSAFAASDSEYSVTAGNAHWWWLRTPFSSYSCRVRYVSSDGSLSDGSAYLGYGGVRPLFNLSSEISVSDSTDADGCYTLSFEQGISAPTISVQDEIYCSPTYETGGMTGGTAEITWTSVNGAESYVLERAVNNGAFVQIYAGTGTSYTENVISSMQSLQYRVKAVSAAEGDSAYATSPVRVVQDNFPPFISGDEANLGVKPSRFSYDYIIYDGDDVVITVKEYLNSDLLRQYTASTGYTQTLEIPSDKWAALPVGDNYLKIVVTDDNNASATQIKHFTKLSGVLDLVYDATGDIAIQPKAINVELDLVKPLASDLQVLACNNANDTVPAWEDITTAVKAGINHVFANGALENTSSAWKVKIRIIVRRNGAVGDIKLRGIRYQLDANVE